MVVMFFDERGEYKCDTGMSVEDVCLNIRTQKGRLIEHKLNTGWTVGVVKSVEKKKSVAASLRSSLQCR